MLSAAGAVSSSASVSSAVSSSEVSQARMNWSLVGGECRRDGTVRWVRDEEADVLELPARELGCEFENEADAAADAKEDSAVGATASGTMVP
jgi:hypothetical protein